MDDVRPLHRLGERLPLPFGELEAVFRDQPLEKRDFQLRKPVDVLLCLFAGGQDAHLMASFAKLVRETLRGNACPVVVGEVGVYYE